MNALDRLTAYLCQQPGTDALDAHHADMARQILDQHTTELDAARRGTLVEVDVDAALSPTLAALRDIIETTPGRPGAEIAAARVLLAAHARELATLIYGEVQADRQRNPGDGGDGRNHVRRGGMMTAQQVIDRYADDLDAAALDGAS